MDSAIQRLNNRALDPGGNQLIYFSEDKAQSTRIWTLVCNRPHLLTQIRVMESWTTQESRFRWGITSFIWRMIDSCEKKKRFQKYLESCGRGLNRELWILRREQLPDFLNTSSAHAWTSVILAGKRDRRCHSTTSFSKSVVVARKRVIKCKKFFHSAIGRELNLLQYK